MSRLPTAQKANMIHGRPLAPLQGAKCGRPVNRVIALTSGGNDEERLSMALCKFIRKLSSPSYVILAQSVVNHLMHVDMDHPFIRESSGV